MKPLQLSMKAFGAFAEECRIDFTPFDKSGIYLITGETVTMQGQLELPPYSVQYLR